MKEEKRARQKPGDEHYVNNHTFTLALDSYARDCKTAKEKGLEKPVMPKYVAECIMKMAFRLSLTPRFRNYSYRDEMVQNGILGAVKYAHKFDGDRFDNGFAYITQILFSHMVITIKNEKKLYKTNLELIQQALVSNINDPELSQFIDEHAREIADQKLQDLEQNSIKGKGGFQLRTGWTKKSRSEYTGGTPLIREKETIETFFSEEEKEDK